MRDRRARGLKFDLRAKAELEDLGEHYKDKIGYQLDRVQRGMNPNKFRPMPDVGAGVVEIKVSDRQGSNVGRCFYVAKFADAVYVLHCFEKKSQKTPKRNLDIGRERYKELLESRRK